MVEPPLSVYMHGSNLTAEAAQEVGDAMCGQEQPFDAPRSGWHYADGDDICPACLLGDFA